MNLVGATMSGRPFEALLLYVVILAFYVPWMIYAVRARLFSRVPLIAFCFLGMFTQNALGSIGVMFPDLLRPPRNAYFTDQFVLMLVVQIVIFYAMAGPYIYFTRPRVRQYELRPKADGAMAAVMGLFCLTLVALYIREVGTPPVIKALTGSLSGFELIEYRVQATYGLADYSMYHVGLNTLPTLLSIWALCLAEIYKRKRLGYAIILGCVFVASFPGGKGSILDLVTALMITYFLLLAGSTPMKPKRPNYWRIARYAGYAFIPVFLMYRVYYGTNNTAQLLFAIFYRTVGVNSESMAATILYTNNFGFFEGATLPNLRGLFDHTPVSAAGALHNFMFGPGGGAPTSALAEGYMNYGWLGFVGTAFLAFALVIGAQHLLRLLPRTMFTFSLLVLYSVFATKIAQLSIFASFISLTYTALFTLMVATRFVIAKMVSAPRVAAAPPPDWTPPGRFQPVSR